MVSKALRAPHENMGEMLVSQGAVIFFHIKGTISEWGCCDEIPPQTRAAVVMWGEAHASLVAGVTDRLTRKDWVSW